MTCYRNLNCPACGAPAENVDRFAAMAVCEYCGGAFCFRDDAVEAMGRMAIMVDYPTPLYVGATGSIRGRRFAVAGRLRYRYARGFWDEWYLRWDDGADGWLCEDERELSLEEAVPAPGPVPPRGSLRPGQGLTLAGALTTVDEVDTAHLEGAEGWLPFVLTADTAFPYVDASQGDVNLTIEYAAAGPEVFRGHPVDEAELVLDHPREDGGGGEWSDA